MAGDDAQNKGIPAWQRAGADKKLATQPVPEETEQPQAHTQESQRSSDDQNLVAQARRFLEDESVRNRSEAEKISFLESKGMTKDDIKNAMDSVKSSAGAQQQQQQQQQQTSQPISTQDPARRPQIPRRDPAPIITYPESMAQATKPPPIITGPRLLNTAYAAAGVTALVYGASKYLIQPLFESLSAARHDFAAHSKTHLDQLNEKLSEVASKIPQDRAPDTRSEKDGDIDDNASYNSDPTELFHRDFGTQTADLDSASEEMFSEAPVDTMGMHVLMLEKLQKMCDQVSQEEQSESDSYKEISSYIKVLNEQLDGMSIPASTFSYYNHFETAGRKQKDDEITRFKNETRNFKGQLLNARNFPRR